MADKNLTMAIRAPFLMRHMGFSAADVAQLDVARDNGFNVTQRNYANTANYLVAGSAVDDLFISPYRNTRDAYGYGLRVTSLRLLAIGYATKAGDTVFGSTAHGLQVGQALQIKNATGDWAALNGTQSVKAVTSVDIFTINPDSSTYTGIFDGEVYARDAYMIGGAAVKSYVFNVDADRAAASVSTGDSNDALVRINGNNYADNDDNFIFRGLNLSTANRSGGHLGRLDNAIGVQGKSGGTVHTIVGLSITAENYGTVSDLFGGVDILLKNEAAVATTEFGLRLRNENNSIAGPVAGVLHISDTGANTGWTNFVVFEQDAGMPAVSTCSSVSAIGTKGYITVKVGSATRYIGLSETIT